MKRAFAKIGTARFLADPDDASRIWAEEECRGNPFSQRAYWHSAGVVPAGDLRRAVKHKLKLQWVAPAGSCPFAPERHSVRLTAEEVGLVLVALDSALERGLPPRCAVDLKRVTS